MRPQVLVTYDDAGGYGHPDHIMAHRVATAAVEAAADPAFAAAGGSWQVSKLYWTAMPRVGAGRRPAGGAGGRCRPSVRRGGVGPASCRFGCDDELVSTAIAAEEQADAKLRALAAHRTQVSVHGSFFALSNNLGQPVLGTEYFRLALGSPAGERDAQGRETDLFAGIAEDTG